MPRQPTNPTILCIAFPFQKTVCDLTVFPARLAGGRTTNQAVSAGRGFGDDCARTHTDRKDHGGVQGELVGVQHKTIVTSLAEGWLTGR
jgi:hypothetical protein